MTDSYNACVADRRITRHDNRRRDIRAITDEDVAVRKCVCLLAREITCQASDLRLRDVARQVRCRRCVSRIRCTGHRTSHVCARQTRESCTIPGYRAARYIRGIHGVRCVSNSTRHIRTRQARQVRTRDGWKAADDRRALCARHVACQRTSEVRGVCCCVCSSGMADRYCTRVADRCISRHNNCCRHVRTITDENVAVSKNIRLLAREITCQASHLRLCNRTRDTRSVTGNIPSDLCARERCDPSGIWIRTCLIHSIRHLSSGIITGNRRHGASATKDTRYSPRDTRPRHSRTVRCQVLPAVPALAWVNCKRAGLIR